MNRHQLREKSVGRFFRLRPLPRRITIYGERLPPEDDQWKCIRVTHDYMELSNLRTGHFVNLSLDHVREYMSTDMFDMFILKSQITLHDRNLSIEPLFFVPGYQLSRNRARSSSRRRHFGRS